MSKTISHIIESILDKNSTATVALIKESLYAKLAEKIVNYKSSVKESFITEQSNLDKLKEIIKKSQRGLLKFDNGDTLPVDLFTASAVVQVYDALKQKPAQEKLLRMIQKDKFQFMKVASFAFSKSGTGIK